MLSSIYCGPREPKSVSASGGTEVELNLIHALTTLSPSQTLTMPRIMQEENAIYAEIGKSRILNIKSFTFTYQVDKNRYLGAEISISLATASAFSLPTNNSINLTAKGIAVPGP